MTAEGGGVSYDSKAGGLDVRMMLRCGCCQSGNNQHITLTITKCVLMHACVYVCERVYV